MKLFKTHIIFWAIFAVISNLSAMTQVARQSKPLTRSAVIAARTGTEGLAAARTGIARTAESTAAIRARSTLSLPKNQVTRQAYNQAFRKEHPKKIVQNPKVIAAALGTAAGLAVLVEAEEIVDTVHTLFNMAMFDEDLISDQFSNAIVRIYGTSAKKIEGTVRFTYRASAFIVQSEQHQDLYFVVTAAHCVDDKLKQVIAVRDRQDPSIAEYIEVLPIIIDNDNDVAVLLIPQLEIKKIKDETGEAFPAIPASRLSSIKPHKNEALALQGYPAFLSHMEPGYYRKKFVSKGPEISEPSEIPENGPFAGKKIPAEKLSAWNHEDLSGASGSPIIGVKNKQAQVIGIYHGAVYQEGGSGYHTIYSTGVGGLPEYIQKAEKIQKDKEEVNRSEKNQTTEHESWSDYFKRTFGGK
jgi:hypothetical protein